MFTKEAIAEKLATDNNWLFRGILAIYARQTATEQASETTQEDNGVGFNGADANILSSFAKQIQQWNSAPANNRRFNTPLSQKQVELARKKMKKYAKQLAGIANANHPAPQAPSQAAPARQPGVRRPPVTVPADYDM